MGIFPNDAAALRLITAVVVETHDERAVAELRYLRDEPTVERNESDPAADEVAPLAITA